MAKNRSSNALQTGVNIEQELYKSKAALPNEHQVNAKFYSDIGAQFNDAGKRPRGLLNNLGAGLAKGAAAGEMTQDVAKKNKDYDEYAEKIDYLRAVNNTAVERNEWFEKKEMARKQAMPQVVAYANNVDKLDSQSRFLMVRGIVKSYGKAIGEDLDLLTLDGVDPLLGTIQTKDGNEFFDIRTLFANDELMEQQIASKTPQYLEKHQEERADKQKEIALKQQEVDFRYPKRDEDQYPEGQTLTINDQTYDVGSLDRIEQTARSDYQKDVHKDAKNITKNNHAIKAIEDMEAVFKRNPNIGTKFVNMLDDPNGVDSWWNIIGRDLSGQDLTDMEILKKAQADLNLDVILGISGKVATDMLKQAVKDSSPSGKLSKGGFDKISGKWKAKALEQNELASARYKAMQKGKSLIPTPYKGQEPKAPSPSEGKYDLSDTGSKPRQQ